jgi:hypothetical protein
MNIRKMLFIAGLMVAFTILLPVVHADDWNQATRVTFSQPVQIPGHVLPAGTYWFQLSDTIANIELYWRPCLRFPASVMGLTSKLRLRWLIVGIPSPRPLWLGSMWARQKATSSCTQNRKSKNSRMPLERPL